MGQTCSIYVCIGTNHALITHVLSSLLIQWWIFFSWEAHFIHFKMTYCRCYSCKYLLRYELKTECGQIFANFFGMTWVHIKIHKKFIIYSFSFRFSGNVADMLIINFCYQLILINLYLWGKVTFTSSFTLCLTYFVF